jgi:hypothetical protein
MAWSTDFIFWIRLLVQFNTPHCVAECGLRQSQRPIRAHSLRPPARTRRSQTLWLRPRPARRLDRKAAIISQQLMSLCDAEIMGVPTSQIRSLERNS